MIHPAIIHSDTSIQCWPFHDHIIVFSITLLNTLAGGFPINALHHYCILIGVTIHKSSRCNHSSDTAYNHMRGVAMCLTQLIVTRSEILANGHTARCSGCRQRVHYISGAMKNYVRIKVRVAFTPI